MMDYEQAFIQSIADMMTEELIVATEKFGPFNSAHEGYAVIKEELDELWDEIKSKDKKGDMFREAIQIGAMAMRFIIDIRRLTNKRRGGDAK